MGNIPVRAVDGISIQYLAGTGLGTDPDPFFQYRKTAPYTRVIPIVTSDTVNFIAGACQAIYVGVAGNIQGVVNGIVVTFMAVPVGTILPIQFTRINLTNTTASALLALY